VRGKEKEKGGDHGKYQKGTLLHYQFPKFWGAQESHWKGDPIRKGGQGHEKKTNEKGRLGGNQRDRKNRNHT